MTNDFATREKLGAEPLKPVIKKILNLKSLKDLEKYERFCVRWSGFTI